MKKYFDIARHYDSVSEGWRYIFGDNFHFGYFRNSGDHLNKATDNLIEKLAALCELKQETRILDAGCGIGTPAVYLYDKFGSDITGISTSKKGVELANSRIQEDKYKGKVRFMLADMASTEFPDKSFDVVWVMESSHLIKNKKILFDECYRLLKPGGVVLLADIMLKQTISLSGRLKNIFKLISLLKTFGKGSLEKPERYAYLLRDSGFRNMFSENIVKETEGTLIWWRRNIAANRFDLIKVMGENGTRRFEKAVEALQYFFKKDFFCYYLFKAEK